MNYMDEVSKRIVELREAKGETQQELADAIGITRQSLSRYEIAARTINVDVLGALAKHFNVSADYLLGLSGTKSTDKDIQIARKATGLSEDTIIKIMEDTVDAKAIDVLVNSTIKNDTFEETSIIKLISNYFSSAEPDIFFDVSHELSHIVFEKKPNISKEKASQIAERMFEYFLEEKLLNDIKEALQIIWNEINNVHSSSNTEQENTQNG